MIKFALLTICLLTQVVTQLALAQDAGAEGIAPVGKDSIHQIPVEKEESYSFYNCSIRWYAARANAEDLSMSFLTEFSNGERMMAHGITYITESWQECFSLAVKSLQTKEFKSHFGLVYAYWSLNDSWVPFNDTWGYVTRFTPTENPKTGSYLVTEEGKRFDHW